MKVFNELRTWIGKEDGNVTVDWVVLVAMALAFSFVALGAISGGTEELGEKTETELVSRDVGF